MLPAIKRRLLGLLMSHWAKQSSRPGSRPEQVSRIALWQFGGVGDMLLATPVITALQQAYPSASIQIWCSHPGFAEFLQRFPAVQGVEALPVYDFDSRTLLHGSARRELNALLDAMKAQRPELLVNLHVPALLDWWAVEWWLLRRLAPAFSLGFDPRFMRGRSLFDVSLNATERDGTHYTRLYRKLLEKGGIPCGESTLFPVTEEERVRAGSLLAELAPGDAPRVCLHVGARRLKVEGSMWPLERFVVLAEKLLDAGILPVLTGVEGEREMADGICTRLPRCANLVGCTSLGEMAAVIAQCDGFIGHDSGPFHVAAAVGTPCVAICGRPDAEPEYLDYRRDDVFVLTADSPQAIGVDAVFEHAIRMLARD